MGNEIKNKQQSISKKQEEIYENIPNNYRKYHNQHWGTVRNITHSAKLTLYSIIQSNNYHNIQNIGPPLLILNHQTLFKPNSSSETDFFKPIIAYYLKRQHLTSENQSLTSNNSSDIIKLLNFSIKNQITNQFVYPKNLTLNQNQNKKPNLTSVSSCGFKQIFRNYQKQPSAYNTKRSMYTINFLHEFFPSNLQNEIKYRAQNAGFFREKQILSIVYCCCKEAQKMISNNLKQPILSPAAIFITENCEIKVGQWQLISYYFSTQESHQTSIFQDEGEAIITNEIEMTLNSRSTNLNSNQDILTKYYWPPEGLVEIQNVLRLGEINNKNDQKLSEAKNAQVFCLAMTILQMLTLKPYYQKTTYSEKQLIKLIQQAVDIRQLFGQPISQEIINLLLQMLQWDTTQRFTFQNVIQYIHHVFEQNQEIFRDSMNFESQSCSRIKFNDNSYFKTDRRQNGSLATDFSIDPFLTKNQNSSQQQASNILKNVNITVSLEDGSLLNDHQYLKNNQIDLKNGLLDSGIINQGIGDNYNPDHSDEQEEEYMESNDEEEKMQNNNNQTHGLQFLSPIHSDPCDQPQTHSYQMQLIPQPQTPDIDIDYYPSDITTNQQIYQNHLSQFKSLNNNHSAQNPFILIENQFPSSSQNFIINQYVPENWRNWKSINRTLNNYNGMQIQFNQTLDLMRSYDLKILGKSEMENSKNMNEQIQSTPEINIKPLELQNFSSILKQVASPFPSPKMQNKQSTIFKPYEYQSQNDKIFTSPNIMEIIREFTKKQNQQTPDFQNIQLPSTKQSYFETDFHLPKKLQFQSKSPTFNQSRFKSFENRINSEFNSQSKNPPNEGKLIENPIEKEVQREQFTKGWYQGAKKNGARNGYGTFYYKQGGKYSGYWYNNKMDGHGTLFYPDGRVAYQGQWQNDSLHGKGILLNENPKPIAESYDFRSFDQCQNQEYWTSYDGWFENDQKAGFGELLLSNNQKYVGEFKNDMVHGKGKFYKIDGTVVEGLWEHNQLIQKL